MNKDDFKKWLEKCFEFMPDLPFKNTDRNANLRNDIIKRVFGVECDERADFYGLPEGCRIRDGKNYFTE